MLAFGHDRDSLGNVRAPPPKYTLLRFQEASFSIPLRYVTAMRNETYILNGKVCIRLWFTPPLAVKVKKWNGWFCGATCLRLAEKIAERLMVVCRFLAPIFCDGVFFFDVSKSHWENREMSHVGNWSWMVNNQSLVRGSPASNSGQAVMFEDFVLTVFINNFLYSHHS